MNREFFYKVPDFLEKIYFDVVSGLYSSSDKNRIKYAKFNLACDFLLNSDISIDEIVVSLDFPDKNSFIDQFKSFIGITPEKFRERFSPL